VGVLTAADDMPGGQRRQGPGGVSTAMRHVASMGFKTPRSEHGLGTRGLGVQGLGMRSCGPGRRGQARPLGHTLGARATCADAPERHGAGWPWKPPVNTGLTVDFLKNLNWTKFSPKTKVVV
jgi:hypothetical protein